MRSGAAAHRRVGTASVIVALACAACEPRPFHDVVVRPVATETWARGLDGEPPTLFLNRCREGCTITPAAQDDARFDRSSVATRVVELPPFPHGDDIWEKTVACVQRMFEPFELRVTDVDPRESPHFENYVSGTPADLGLDPWIGGVASFDCGVIANATSFTFAGSLGDDPVELCRVIAHEAGHNFGLQHELTCKDPMTYLPDCGPHTFQRVDVECGEYSPRPCDCGLPYQNTYLSLLESFGPRRTPIETQPIVHIAEPDLDGTEVEPRFPIFVEADDPNGITRVTLSIDGAPAGTSTLAPHVFRAPPDLSPGTRVLLARAWNTTGQSDTSTRTVELVVPRPPVRRDAGVAADAAITPADAGAFDAGTVVDVDDGGCSCSALDGAERGGLSSLLVVAALGALGCRRRRAIGRVLGMGLGLSIGLGLALAGCATEDSLGTSTARVELSPPPGTPLVFDESVLGRSVAPPIIVRVKSLGTAEVVLAPAPVIEGDAGFRVSSAPRRVGADRDGEIFVRFSPTETGTKTAELVVHTNDRALPVARYPVVAPVREPCRLSASPPHQRVELRGYGQFTVRAEGTTPCTLLGLATDRTLFEVVDEPSFPQTLAPGASLTFRVHHFQRTQNAGIPVRRVTIREREGTTAEVSLEGAPPAWDCFDFFPRHLTVPTAPLGVPVRAHVAVTNGCTSRAYVTGGWFSVGGHAFELAEELPLGVDPFTTAKLEVVYTPFSETGDAGRLVLLTDDAAYPRVELDVLGRGLVPRAVMVPSLDLGGVPFDARTGACRSTRATLSIFSAGVVDLVVQRLAIEGSNGFTIERTSIDGVPQDPRAPIQIPPGASLDVELSFRPLHLAPSLHTDTLVVEHTAIPGTNRVTLTGHAVPTGRAEETFVQPQGPEADVLFVVDDSLSMQPAVGRLRAASSAFLERAEAVGARYHVAATKADGTTSFGGVLQRCPTDTSVLTPDDGDAAYRRRWMDCALYVPPRGRLPQAGLGAAVRAIARAIAPPPTDGTVPSPSARLLRRDARLAIVIASNDEDQSVETTTVARRYLAAAKGAADLVTVHALAVPRSGACADGTPWAVPGARYAEIAAATGGLFADVCAPDFTPALVEIADRTFVPRTSYVLDRSADPRTLLVDVDGTVITEDPHEGWSFEPAARTLRLHGSAIAAPGATIRATYDVICEPN